MIDIMLSADDAMKILVIPTTDWIKHPFPNRINFIFDILAEKHDVYVLHFNLKRFKENEARDTKCKLVDAGLIEVADPSLYYILNSPIHLLKIREIVKRENIDVIVSTNILPSFMANFAGVPIVFDYLDHLEESAAIYYPDSFFGKLVKTGVRQIVRYNIRRANYIITVTDELKSLLQAMGAENIAVIPNGVDTHLLRPISKEKAKDVLGLEGDVIGYVGSLEHWVDLETVVEALPHLDVTLLVIGPGLFTDYGDKIKELAERFGVIDKMIFTGTIPYSQLNTYISAMDIGLNPLKKMKKNEMAVGGKVFNYLSCGVPVLSSRMISLVELLGDDLFYYDDKDSFIKMTKGILSSQHDNRRYREIAKQFDWRTIAKNYEAVLRQVV